MESALKVVNVKPHKDAQDSYGLRKKKNISSPGYFLETEKIPKGRDCNQSLVSHMQVFPALTSKLSTCFLLRKVVSHSSSAGSFRTEKSIVKTSNYSCTSEQKMPLSKRRAWYFYHLLFLQFNLLYACCFHSRRSKH